MTGPPDPSVSRRRLAGALLTAAVAVVGGWLTAGLVGLIPGALLGVIGGYAVGTLDVRTGVALPVVASTFLGAIVGRSIIRAICLPRSCTGFEIVTGTVTAIGAFVGVGLVVALVTRSFDEYRSSRTIADRGTGDDESAR